MSYIYVVVKTEAPEWDCAQFYDIYERLDIDGAMEDCEALEEANDEDNTFYTVEVRRL